MGSSAAATSSASRFSRASFHHQRPLLPRASTVVMPAARLPASLFLALAALLLSSPANGFGLRPARAPLRAPRIFATHASASSAPAPVSSSSCCSSSRRAFTSLGLGALVSVAAGSSAVHAAGLTSSGNLTPCPDGANNCRSSAGGGNLPAVSAWKSGKAAKETFEDLLAVVEAYPQKGQNNIDGGGWAIAEKDADSGYLRVEYTSKIFKFVDDLEFKVGKDGTTQVRSSSRVGDSDLGVNTKRLEYFAAQLSKLGWKTDA